MRFSGATRGAERTFRSCSPETQRVSRSSSTPLRKEGHEPIPYHVESRGHRAQRGPPAAAQCSTARKPAAGESKPATSQSESAARESEPAAVHAQSPPIPAESHAPDTVEPAKAAVPADQAQRPEQPQQSNLRAEIGTEH